MRILKYVFFIQVVKDLRLIDALSYFIISNAQT